MSPDPTSERVAGAQSGAGLWSQLPERYRRLMKLKSVEVEEPIDMYFHRPVAAGMTSLILDLPIRPNHVTYASLLTGWAGSVALYAAAFVANTPRYAYALAGLLLFASVILDCADGQLARAKGGGTRLGRILDGVVDALVLLPAYALMVLDLARQYGSHWIWLGAFAGFTSWAQIVIYDKIKSVFLAHTHPGSSDGGESPEAAKAELEQVRAEGFSLDFVLLWLYVRVLLRIQNRFVPGTSPEPETSPESRLAFSARHRATMRLVSYLGLGTHMLFVYSAVFLATWWPLSTAVIQVLFGIGFNSLLVVVLSKSRALRAYHPPGPPPSVPPAGGADGG